jgi:hypothetical protein
MSGIMQANIGSWQSLYTPPVLVYDLDAADYSAVPVNGSTIAGTGAFPITVANAGSSVGWSATNGVIFTKSNESDK